MSGLLTGKEKGKENSMSKGTEVYEDVVYLQGLDLPRIVLVYICCPNVINNGTSFTLKYVLNMYDKLYGHLFIWKLKLIQ